LQAPRFRARSELRRAKRSRRFPAERRTIEELTIRDDDFRDMCDELAEAELALEAAEALPPHIREQRTADDASLGNCGA